MKFASVRELKNNTSDLLRRANNGDGILITSHGKPVAALQGITEENLEDFILSNHPEIRYSLKSAYNEYKAKGGTPVQNIIKRAKKRHGKSHR